MNVFAWATWADDSEIAFTLERVRHPILDEVHQWLPLEDAILVKPEFEFQNLELQIYFAALAGGGVVSGGACGNIGDEGTRLRALGELARHAAAVKKIKYEGVSTSGIYETRLAYLASLEGSKHLAARLTRKGSRPVTLPSLMLDGSVSHSLSEAVAVHRCYFENQPPFVSGPAERLCL